MPRMTSLTKLIRRNPFGMILLSTALTIGHFGGLFDHLFELNYEDFRWPLDVDLRKQIERLREDLPPEVLPLRQTRYDWILKNESRCADDHLFLVILVKSAVENRQNRDVIRETWGRDRDVRCQTCEEVKLLPIRRYFLLGSTPHPQSMTQLSDEQQLHGDILQQNFIDFYYNNTIKTLMGLKFASENCQSAKFFLFVDDDYHIGVANLIRLLLDMKNDTDDLYLGFRFFTHVMRHHWSPFRLSLTEYPFVTFPPYITAGAYVLSAQSVKDFHLGAQFIRPFRFDDVYMGIIAKKLDIRPQHNEKFLFWQQPYSRVAFKDVIAAHGFKDLQLMRKAARDTEDLLESL